MKPRTLNIRLTDEMRDSLEKLALKDDIPAAQIVRKAIAAYLPKPSKPEASK